MDRHTWTHVYQPTQQLGCARRCYLYSAGRGRHDAHIHVSLGVPERPNTGASVLTDPSQALRYKGDRTESQCSHAQVGPSLFTTFDDENSVLRQELFNPVVLSQIVLPNGQTYIFTYNI